MEKTVYLEELGPDTSHLERRLADKKLQKYWARQLTNREISLSSTDSLEYGLASLISATERGNAHSHVDVTALYRELSRITQNPIALQNLDASSFMRQAFRYAALSGLAYEPGCHEGEARGIFGLKLRNERLDVPTTAESARLFKHMVLSIAGMNGAATAPGHPDQGQGADQTYDRDRERDDHERSR
jgi:hypothetical protein